MKQREKSKDFNTTNEINEFEEDMKNLNEWQENQYNPGYYIGTGRVPRPISKLGKFSGFLVLIGILILLLPIYALINMDYSKTENVFSSITALTVPIILGVIFIYGGIKRWINGSKA